MEYKRLVLVSFFMAVMSLFVSSQNVESLDSVCQGADLSGLCWDADIPGFEADAFLPVFAAYEISDYTFARMQGKSYGEDCTTPRSKLRYLILPHYDGHGYVRIGEMVCNAAIAEDLIDIFRELFKLRYPIERMVLVDEYGGDDEASMQANNTSCFNFRRIAGKKKLSRHAFGMAVDINPLYNPYVRTVKGRRIVAPAGAERYTDRSNPDIPFMITKKDAAYKLFRKHGFRWGGSWRNRKDYQHFQK